MTDFIEKLKFNEQGLIPAIAQDSATGEVLMLAYMNKESIRLTMETGKVHYFSRSRQQLWLKGETSGNFQDIKEIYYDCDSDALLLKIRQTGPACHTGNDSCFFNSIELGLDESKEQKGCDRSSQEIINELFEVISDRKKNPKEDSYTNYLFNKGIDKILKKVGEESAEVIIAAKNSSVDETRYEMADLFYHLLVLMSKMGMHPNDVFGELKERR